MPLTILDERTPQAMTPEQFEDLYNTTVPPVPPPTPRIIDDIIRHRDEQLNPDNDDRTLHGTTFDYDDPSDYTRSERRRPNVRAPSIRTRDTSTKKCKHTGGPQYNRLRFTSSLESDG